MTSLSFDLPYYWLIPACLITAGSLWLCLRMVFARLAPSPRRRLVAALNILAHGCVLLLLADPQVPSHEGTTVTLVTDSSGTEILSAQQLYLAPWLQTPGTTEGKSLPSISALAFLAPEATQLRIIGAGLNREDWRHIPASWRVNWDASATPEGLVAINWPQQVNVGEEWVLSGQLMLSESDASDIFTVSLRDPADREVAARKVKNGDRFMLPARTGIGGPLLYSVQLTDRDGTLLQQEAAPVAVHSQRPPRILVVQSSPSFETRHMSNWASSYGAELYVHTRISKGRYLLRSNNEEAAEHASDALPVDFRAYDMAIMDGRAYLDLEREQKSSLEDAVNAGLGLMIVADSALVEATPSDRSNLLAPFHFEKQEKARNSSLPAWDGAPKAEIFLPVLPVEITATEGNTIVSAADGSAINVVTSYGMGRVSVSRLRQRFAWATAGETGLYTSYWAHIQKQVSRVESLGRLVPHSSTEITYAGKASAICALNGSSGAVASVARLAYEGEAEAIPLSPDNAGSGRFCSTYVPTAAGWHTRSLHLADGTLIDQDHFYAFAQTDWISNEQRQRILATQDRISRAAEASAEAQFAALKSLIRPLWLGVIFLFAAAVLWAERKIP
jgi:hypothetical protein